MGVDESTRGLCRQRKRGTDAEEQEGSWGPQGDTQAAVSQARRSSTVLVVVQMSGRQRAE